MVEQTQTAIDPRAIRRAVTQWVGGMLFMIGLLGFLRRHFEGFVEAPGAFILGMTATPLGYLILFALGCAGIAALRAPRIGAVYLPLVAGVLFGLAIIGTLAGGADANGLAINGRMTLVLVALGVVATVGAVIVRRLPAVS